MGVFALAFLALLVYFGLKATEKETQDRDVLISNAGKRLGDQMQVIFPERNLNSDIELEILAVVPLNAAEPFVFDDEKGQGKVKAAVILQKRFRKTVELLTLNQKALNTETEQLALDQAGKPVPGFLLEFEYNRKTNLYEFFLTQLDEKGAPASDALQLVWDTRKQTYRIGNP
jgi:hypothetical protein